MNTLALGIIDAQRGFMPAAEGERLARYGFGELPVPEGEQIVRALHSLIGTFAMRGNAIFTTQDWHPEQTAHFSPEPDYVHTWPRHCVARTPGARLHPGLRPPSDTRRFIKGFEPLERGEDDMSYSGYYARDINTGESLPEWLQAQGITKVVLGGLALDYCVGKTALDLRKKLGLDVIVAIEATRGIAEASTKEMMNAFERAGIRTANNLELITGRE